MLISLKEVVEEARSERYAVLAVNCFNFETARAAITGAEELNAPIIINLFSGHIDRNISFEDIAGIVKRLAVNTHIPVVLNLDHGADLESCKKALQNGFTGVMIDASSLPLSKNIETCKEVVKEAQKYDAGVEGELGHMGNASEYNSQYISSLYTDVAEVEEFIEMSRIDALAISCGTAHGLYAKDLKPKINFDLIEQINQISSVPLVMHGGSGIDPADLRKAVNLGISKVNVGADIFNAGKEGIIYQLEKDPNIELSELILSMEKACKEKIKSYILNTNSNDRVKRSCK